MTTPIIHYYQAIETTSKAMLDAALTENWDEVVRLEGACALLIEQLRERSLGIDMSAEERAEKHRIMMTILRHDAQIRELVDPWMEDSDQMRYHVAPAQLHCRQAAKLAPWSTPPQARRSKTTGTPCWRQRVRW